MARRSAQHVEPAATAGIPRVKWSRLRWWFIDAWDPGEHLSVIGPTGSGKSFVALDVLKARASRRDAHVLALATKRRDETMTDLGWPIITQWPPTWDQRQGRRIILWPPYGKASTDVARKREIFTEALDEVLEEGGWTVYVDEAIYLTETLKMRPILDEYWNTARSAGITVVAASQGVSWVPRAALTQQQWLIAFRFSDEETLSDVARVAGSRQRYRDVIGSLREYEFLLVHTRSGLAYISKVGT